MIEELYGEVEENQTIEVRSILCYQAWLTVLADTYLFLLRVIPGDTRQFKATLLILQGSSISVKLFMAIFQHQSQPDPKRDNEGNAVEIPPLIHLTMP